MSEIERPGIDGGVDLGEETPESPPAVRQPAPNVTTTYSLLSMADRNSCPGTVSGSGDVGHGKRHGPGERCRVRSRKSQWRATTLRRGVKPTGIECAAES
jgi:hypothetical protein